MPSVRRLSAAFCLLALFVSGAAAEVLIPAPPTLKATSWILIDAETGKVLAEHDADVRLPPASLTKLMTSFIAANEIAEGRVTRQDMVPVSVKAWRTGGSKMFIREGTQVSLDDLLRGVIIQSGNDASVAVAEYLAGTEDAFADLMNRMAERLGMVNSHFENATGLPAEGHLTTARDLATLSRALIRRHPEHYRIYSEPEFTYNDIRQPNRNRLLARDTTIDGIKTGHTEAAGYCLAASGERDGTRLISVVMGTASEAARADETQALLTWGFRFWRTHKVYDAGAELRSAQVWYGAAPEVKLGTGEPIVLTVPRGHYDDLEPELTVANVIEAPFAEGDAFGTLAIRLDGEVLYEGDVVALHAVEEAGVLKRLWHAILLFFTQLFG